MDKITAAHILHGLLQENALATKSRAALAYAEELIQVAMPESDSQQMLTYLVAADCGDLTEAELYYNEVMALYIPGTFSAHISHNTEYAYAEITDGKRKKTTIRGFPKKLSQAWVQASVLALASEYMDAARAEAEAK